VSVGCTTASDPGPWSRRETQRPLPREELARLAACKALGLISMRSRRRHLARQSCRSRAGLQACSSSPYLRSHSDPSKVAITKALAGRAKRFSSVCLPRGPAGHRRRLTQALQGFHCIRSWLDCSDPSPERPQQSRCVFHVEHHDEPVAQPGHGDLHTQMPLQTPIASTPCA